MYRSVQFTVEWLDAVVRPEIALAFDERDRSCPSGNNDFRATNERSQAIFAGAS